MMQIVDVNEYLGAYDKDEPLRLEPIAVLEPLREPYQVLLCQPHGILHVSRDRIGNANPEASAQMYGALFREAIDRQSQLVVTPEYSVPWMVIDEIARRALRPPPGSLWALGFESITPDDLDHLRNSLVDVDDVRLLHEPIDPQQRAQRRFMDPLVYIFWARDSRDANVLCFLIQFKTVASRDEDHVEITSLYLGRTVYRFRLPEPSISLLTIICSDAFELENQQVDLYCRDLLLIHIQLNKSPTNDVFSAYRARLYAVASNNAVEVLCLNWSKGLQIDGMAGQWNEISGSAWYVSPPAGPILDEDVNRLHREGIYYSLVDTRWHGFYLNYAPHLIVIQKRRVFSAGPQVLVQQLAPEVVSRCAWNAHAGEWVDEPPNDGFHDFIQNYDPLVTALPQIGEHDPLAVERAVELLEGPHGRPSDWYSLKQLRALQVADDESLRRVTVSQETNDLRAGVIFRRERARRALAAIGIPGQPLRWPRGASDLANGFRFRWIAGEPHCNVEPLTGNGGPATFIFLGDEPENDTLSNVYDMLSKALRLEVIKKQEAANVVLDPSRAADRLCVVYRRNNILKSYRPSDCASITEPVTGTEDDITRGTT
jgi:hypothetical protein